MINLTAAVEGKVDLAALERLLSDFGIALSTYHGLKGKSALRRSLTGYNHAAQHSPWTVLVDLDRDAECAPELCRAWLPQPAAHMCFQVAVREIESWLIADAPRLAAYLGVPESRIPSDPESLLNPKRSIVDLARQSRRTKIREAIVPRSGSGREVGPAYEGVMQNFARTEWRPATAEERSPSLRRFRRKLENLKGVEA
jgi:hypothetical protein